MQVATYNATEYACCWNFEVYNLNESKSKHCISKHPLEISNQPFPQTQPRRTESWLLVCSISALRWSRSLEKMVDITPWKQATRVLTLWHVAAMIFRGIVGSISCPCRVNQWSFTEKLDALTYKHLDTASPEFIHFMALPTRDHPISYRGLIDFCNAHVVFLHSPKSAGSTWVQVALSSMKLWT